MPELDTFAYVAVFIALALGGTLKGATGMGSPVIAIPVMAGFFDVRLAVVVMVLPNLVTNLWQLWLYRAHRPTRLAWRFAIAGALGAGVGSALLAVIPARALTLVVAGTVLGYVGLRLWRMDFRLPAALADRLALPIGAISGVLQGSAGISAPVSVSFLNATGLDRASFIPTVSLFFAAMCLVQAPSLAALGLFNADLVLLSALSLVPLLAFMPLGARLAQSISPKTFDRLVLCVLALLAVKLIIWP